MRRPWVFIALAVGLVAGAGASACGDDDPGSSSGVTPAPDAALTCEPGQVDKGGACAPVGFDACAQADAALCGGSKACADGTIDFFGEAACQPVGVKTCPNGFTKKGFGCAPIVPSLAGGPCTAGTRAKLGVAACAPVGDCDAAFPPSSATLFVDAAFTAGQLDATHKKTIQEAIDAAPAGATIAIASGAYVGSVSATKAVTLIGRCARDVVVSGAGATTPGVSVDAPRVVRVRGVTITDFELGVDAHGGATVELTDVIVEKNRRTGVSIADKGTTVTVTGSALRGNLPDASGRFGQGVAVGFDAKATIIDSDLDGNGEMAVNALKKGAAKVERSVLRRSLQRASNQAYGWGAGAQSEGSIEVVDSLIEDVFGGAIVAVEKGSVGVARGSVLRDVKPGPTGSGAQTAACALAQLGSELTIEGSTLGQTDGSGIASTDDARAKVKDSTVLGPVGKIDGTAAVVAAKKGAVEVDGLAVIAPGGIGVLVTDSSRVTGSGLLIRAAGVSALAARGEATLSRVVIEGTSRGGSATSPYGAGVFVSRPGKIALEGSVVRGSDGVAVIATGAGASFELRRGAIVSSVAVGDLPGSGVAASAGASVLLEGAAVLGQPGIAIHATDAETSIVLRDATIGDARLKAPQDRGRAVNVQDGARAELTRVAIIRAGEVGITAIGAGATVTATDVVVADVARSTNVMAHGAVSADGASITLIRARIRDNPGAGLIFAGGTGIVRNTRIERNGVGVQATGSSRLVDATAAPEPPEPGAVYVLADTRFDGNQTKIGGNDLPVPGRVLGPK